MTKIFEWLKRNPCKETTDIGSIEEESVVLLDKFTKVFCRIPNDYEEYGDLKFRCKECPFENHETGVCAVKQFKCKYAPNYVDFGAMGDL